MKIFGNTRVQGRIAADTGSFKIFGVSTGDQVPAVVVGGTDSTDKISISDNRSVIAHGQFDYLVTSQDSGIKFDQAKLQAGRVVGFRVQHVTPTTVYTLRTEDSNDTKLAQSSINISTDGGISFKSAYNLPRKIVAFDMFWLNEDEAFVVGGKSIAGNSPYTWNKFSNYGLPVKTSNIDTTQINPIIFKKSANLNDFQEWGTPPLAPYDCATTIAVNTVDPNIIFLGTQRGKIYRSTDGALTWSEVYSINGCINRIKFVTGNSNEIYVVGTNGSIVKATFIGNAGTWNKIDIKDSTGTLLVNKTRDGRVPAFNDILAPNETDVILVGDDHTRILKSSDSGTTWKFVDSGIYADYLPIEMVKSIQLARKNDDNSYTLNGFKYHVAISGNKLFVGANLDLNEIDDPSRIDWVEYELPEEPLDLHLVTESGDDPTQIRDIGYAFILTKTGLYEFNFQTRVLSSKNSFDILSAGDTPQRMAVHSYREIYIITSNAKIIRATKYVYRFGEKFKFVAETSGLTNTDLIAIDTAKNGRIYGGSANGSIIYKATGSIVNDTTYSTDPVTWTTTTTNPTGSASTIIQLQAVDHGTVFALVQDTDSLETALFKTIDTGSSWTKLYIYSEPVKRFVAYDDSNIYTVNRDGNKIYYTNDAFATVNTIDIQADHLNKYYNINYFGLDAAETADIGSIKFLFGGPSGVGSSAGTFSILYNIGPWQDNQWALTCISGEDGYPYWVGGGTTFGAQRGTSTGFGAWRDVGSEPILLTSTNGGDNWSNAISRLVEQEPPIVNNSGGDFAFTSISEGKYFNQFGTDRFNIYKSDNKLNSFEKKNSNLYREDNKYPGGIDGIRKIRFYDSAFGVAVSDIKQFQLNDGSKVSITSDGGTSWRYISSPTLENYNFTSVFITTQSNSGYEIYLTGYPLDESADGIIFKSIDSGKTWTTSYTFPQSINALTYRPRDIFFVNSQTGSVSIFGGIDASPAVEGIYTTFNGGSTWNLTTITDFGAAGTRGHLQFITARKGYVGGAYSSTNNAGLFKTTDSGASWSRISTPFDNISNKPVSGLHFLTEAVGVIGIDNQILRTIDSGSNWTVVHNLKYSGSINEIKFSANGQLGVAVGYYNSANDLIGDHFILKTENSGSSWVEVDGNHGYVDLEFELDANRNTIGQSANLYTVAFAEKIVLTEETQETPEKKDPDTPKVSIDCAGSQFMSASYYNFENFAYKCTPSGSFPRYYPNTSNNIGLGKGIFGQQTSVDLVKLRNKLTYGAALGVGALGKAEYSRGDTATGFGAMDTVRKAKNNVAIGFKALSKNISDSTPTNTNTGNNGNTPINKQVISNVFGITDDGKIVLSINGGESWTYKVLTPSTASYKFASDESGSLPFTKIYKVTENEILTLANNTSGNGTDKTLIGKYSNKTNQYNIIYSSSIHIINGLSVVTPSIICALDTENKTFLRSTSGGRTFSTGSILNTGGNTLNSFKMLNSNFGFIVGSKIWKLQSGSNQTWETSSYTGSNVLNSIDYLDQKTWFAVGTSGSIYKTVNSGVRWTSVTHSITTNTLNDISIAGSTIIAAGNSGSVLVSNNNGVSWKRGNWKDSMQISSSYFPQYNFKTVEFLDQTTVLLGYENQNTFGIIKSSDSGKTWEESANAVDTTDGVSPDTILSFVGTYFTNNPTQPRNPNLNDVNKYTPTLPGQDTPESPVETQTQPSEIVDENVAIGAYSVSEFENSSRIVAVGANALKSVANNVESRLVNASHIIYTDNQVILSGEGSGSITTIINTDVYDLMNIYSNRAEYVYDGEEYIKQDDPLEQLRLVKLPSTYGQVAIGAYSQNKSINSTFNTTVGYAAMYQPNDASCNTAVGFYSHHLANNDRNTSLGVWSLGFNGDLNAYMTSSVSGSIRGGDDNIAIGYGAMLYNISSVRAEQIKSSLPSGSRTNSNSYRVFPSLGSRNLAIGNFALINANGSADTIAIGHKAVSTNGNDLTDSVFIGNFVGQNFQTKIGTYYSSSTNNDWKFTQTVAVGSRTLQNQMGYDIVAVGSNALRGTAIGSNAATPDRTITTEPYHALLFGNTNGFILGRRGISTDFGLVVPNLNNIDQSYSPSKIGDRGVNYNVWETYQNGKHDPSTPFVTYPVSIAIADRDTAYAVLSTLTVAGRIGSYRVPVLVKTNKLASLTDYTPRLGNGGIPPSTEIEWDIVKSIGYESFRTGTSYFDPFITAGGKLKTRSDSATNKPMILNVPDSNTIYLLIKNGKGTENTIADELKSGSYYDVERRDILLKATSDCEFDLLVGAEFEKIKETKYIFEGKRTGGGLLDPTGNGTDGEPISIIMNSMHFPSPTSGIVVGQKIYHNDLFGRTRLPYAQITQDGGNTFTPNINAQLDKDVDITPSGSNITFNDVWMNNEGTFACAVGSHGSIYTWTAQSDTWVKRLGGSNETKITEDFWDSINLTFTGDRLNPSMDYSALVWFRDDYYSYFGQTLQSQIGFQFRNVKFYNQSVGYVAGTGPSRIDTVPRTTWIKKFGGYQVIIGKTTDGGETWINKQITLPTDFCNAIRDVNGETLPQLQEMIVIDENRVILGFSYGQVGYTEDGGQSWKFTSDVYNSTDKSSLTITWNNYACGCDPFQQVLCGDYKAFEGATLTETGSVGDIIRQTVTVGSDAQVKQKAVTDNVAVGYKVQFNGSGSAVKSVQIGSAATFNANEIINTVGVGNETLKTTEYSDGVTAVGAETLFTLEGDKSNPEFPITMINPSTDTGSLRSTSRFNTAVGYKSGYSLKMGDSNVYVGYNAGIFGNEMIPTYGNNNIAIGASSPLFARNRSNVIHIGNALHDLAVLWGQHDQPQPWAVLSDRRDKTETGSFATASSALTFLRELDIKQFKWDSRYMYPSASGSPDGSKRRASSSFGYIAQELETAAIAAGFDSKLFVIDTTGSYSDGTGSFNVKLIKPGMVDLVVHRAVKELDQQIQTSKYTSSLGDGTGSVYSVTHSLNTPDIIAMVYSTLTNRVIYPTMSILSSNTMTITFDTVAAPNEYRLIVMK